MTKVFKAAIGLKQQTKKAIIGTMPTYCTVSSVNGRMVAVTMDGDSEPSGWYPSVMMSNYTGVRGLLVPVQGGSAYFQPMGSSYPNGRLDYTTDTIEIGRGFAIDTSTFQAVLIGVSHSVVGSYGVGIGRGNQISHVAVAIGTTVTTGVGSVGIGYWTKAPGDNAAALGREAEATGINTTAAGYGAKASGERSLALGTVSTATGMRSIAIGYLAVANLDYAMAIGYDAASTNRSLAIGTIAKATGAYSTAVGYGAEAGYASTATHGELALGRNAIAKTARAIAIGYGATTQYHYEARIKARGLIIESSQDGSSITKIGLHSSNGTRYYIYVTDAGVLTTTTSW